MPDADSPPESFLADLATLRQQHAALAAALADQQRAERESDARFRDLIEGSIQGIVIHRNFIPLFANQAYATILGYETPEDILEMGSLLPIFPPAERARLTGYVQARQEGRSVSRQQEHQALRQDGTPIWLDAKIREVTWEGEPALQVTIFDITERKRAEEALRRHANRLHILTRLTQLISSSLDMEEVLGEIARAAALLMDAPIVSFWIVDEATETLTLRAWSDDAMGAHFTPKTLRFGQGGTGWAALHRQMLNISDVFADGRFVGLDWWRAYNLRSCCIVPVIRGASLLAMLSLSGHQAFQLDSDDASLLANFVAQAAIAITNARLFRDTRQQAEALALANAELQRGIAERQQAAEALRVAKDAAEEASRAKSTFLATMSHELRTPLGSIIGFANLLVKNKGQILQPQELLYLERIRANGLHLLGLINDVLDLSKIEAGRVELERSPTWLNALIQEVLAQFSGTAPGAKVQLLTDISPVLAPFDTDANKLRQVLLNLVGNALKFTPRGQVTVRVESDPVTQQPRRIDVSDTGIGIPAERLEGIFECFQQADNSITRRYGGTGLGLTISRSLCQLLGYQLTVHSEVDKGSTFSVVLLPV